MAEVRTAQPVPREVWRARLAVSDAELKAFCERWKIVEFAVFGSVLRDDFGPESDIDVLVTFGEGVHWPWGGLDEIEAGLGALTGRKVDAGTLRAVDEDPNHLRREAILGTMQRVRV